MPDSLLLLGAGIASVAGMGWLALAKPAHWRQVRGEHAPLTDRTRRLLRLAGTIALGLALLSCLAADHVSMAALVWVMTLTTASLAVTFTLSWRPGWLAPLLAGLRT